MVEQALQCLQEADSFTAIEFLNQQRRPAAVAQAYVDLVNVLYWEERDMDHVVAMSRAGIQYASDQALAQGAGSGAYFTLRSSAKALAYNLGSFTWPGWKEANLQIDALHVAAGMDAARLNLRLALELDKGDLPLSRAYWLLGAHLLADGHYRGAQALFGRAAMYARRAAAPLDSALNEAFAALGRLLAQPQDPGGEEAYSGALESLRLLDEQDALVGQVQNARSVFAA